MSDKVIEVKNVSIKYEDNSFLNIPLLNKKNKNKGEFWALKDVNFSIKKGEVTGIIGKNGSGKSTLLKLLTGVIQPDKGEVINHGFSTALLAIGVGFQSNLSGLENIYINGLLLGLSKKEIDERIDDIIDFSELGDFIHKPIRTYSSGMKSRLAFSIGIYIDPDILFIDEVFGVGDIGFKEKSDRVIMEKIQSGKTVVIVTHSGSLVQKLCNQVIWIDNGEVRAQGSTNEILTDYVEYMRNQNNRTKVIKD